MKKALLLTLALLFVCGTAFSAPLKAGVKAGISMATLSGDGIEGVSSKICLVGGAFVNMAMGTLAIQPELLYVQKGAQDDVNSDYKEKADYIELPILVKVGFGAGSVKPCIFAGPAFGILVSAKETDGTNSVDIKDNLNSLDLGLVVGAGVDVNMLTIDLRYDLGLSNLPKTPDGYDGDMPSVKNGAFMAMVGVSF